MFAQYANGAECNLGDNILFRWWLLRRKGRVVYLPGVSRKHDKLEFSGIQHVGIQLNNGVFVALVIDPLTKRLSKRASFVGRSSEPVREIDPTEPLFEE